MVLKAWAVTDSLSCKYDSRHIVLRPILNLSINWWWLQMSGGSKQKLTINDNKRLKFLQCLTVVLCRWKLGSENKLMEEHRSVATWTIDQAAIGHLCTYSQHRWGLPLSPGKRKWQNSVRNIDAQIWDIYSEKIREINLQEPQKFTCRN